jgi:hypothetical protein
VGNSTITLAKAYNVTAVRGIPDPRNAPSGYGDQLAMDVANEVAADFISERFNHKWNSANAVPFYTNSWQQDYPQLAQPQGKIGWGENVTLVDYNSTVTPKPLWSSPDMTWTRALPIVNSTSWRPSRVCWMYNKDLTLGTWPGANVTYYPLITTGPQQANPLMSMLDKNANILIVTGFGTTGSTAPYLPANSAEGTTVADGTVTWTCVSPTSQGFRLNTLPGQTQPTYQVLPVYQIEPPTFTSMQQMLDPIPDSYSRVFLRGLRANCLKASPDPQDLKRGETDYAIWLKALIDGMKQGDRETNSYGLQPVRSVVEDRYLDGGVYSSGNPFGY